MSVCVCVFVEKMLSNFYIRSIYNIEDLVDERNWENRVRIKKSEPNRISNRAVHCCTSMIVCACAVCGKGLSRKNRFLKREKMLSTNAFHLLYAAGQPSIGPFRIWQWVFLHHICCRWLPTFFPSHSFQLCIFISLFTYVRTLSFFLFFCTDIFYVLVADLQK